MSVPIWAEVAPESISLMKGEGRKESDRRWGHVRPGLPPALLPCQSPGGMAAISWQCSEASWRICRCCRGEMQIGSLDDGGKEGERRLS